MHGNTDLEKQHMIALYVINNPYMTTTQACVDMEVDPRTLAKVLRQLNIPRRGDRGYFCTMPKGAL